MVAGLRRGRCRSGPRRTWEPCREARGRLPASAADVVEIARNGQIHDGVGSGVQGYLELAHFALHAAVEGRGADVGVDLHSGG